MKYLFVISLVILSGCASLKDFFIKPELHVIGVYEGTDPGDDGKPWWSKCNSVGSLSCHQKMTERKRKVGGEVIVNVSVTGKPIILGLTAYDKTRWIINASNGVVVRKVILGGYHAQSVEGIDQTTLVEVYTHDTSHCNNCFQGQGDFRSYHSAPSQLTNLTGLKPSSFQGRYTGKEFSIFKGIKQSK